MTKTQKKSARRTYAEKKERAMMNWIYSNLDCYQSFLNDEIEDYKEVNRLTWFFPDDVRDTMRRGWYKARGEIVMRRMNPAPEA